MTPLLEEIEDKIIDINIEPVLFRSKQNSSNHQVSLLDTTLQVTTNITNQIVLTKERGRGS